MDGLTESLLGAAIKLGSETYCEQIKEKLDANNVDIMNAIKNIHMFMRKSVFGGGDLQNDRAASYQKIKNIKALGLNIPRGVISSDLIPSFLDLDKEVRLSAFFCSSCSFSLCPPVQSLPSSTSRAIHK